MSVPRHYDRVVLVLVASSMGLFVAGLARGWGAATSIGFCVTVAVVINWMSVHAAAARKARRETLALEAEAATRDHARGAPGR